jgi:hypothetical protein
LSASDIETEEDNFLPIPEWQRKVLEERLADWEHHPEDEQTWEEAKVDLWSES